jgi:NAD(P)-dependent dehydrogenase (short-subunit alcohol dehydrogenase family)
MNLAQYSSTSQDSAPRLDTEGCHERAFTVNLDGEFGRLEHSFDTWFVVNNGSIWAHSPRPRSAHTATKHAITGLTKSISLDGRKFDIACGQIDIGNAATTMTERMADGVRQVDGTVRPEPRVDVGDVPRAVLYLASLPLEANVATMTVMATQMPFIGRG